MRQRYLVTCFVAVLATPVACTDGGHLQLDDDTAGSQDDDAVDDDAVDDDSGGSTDDDDSYSGPQQATVNLNVHGTVDGQPYELLSMFQGNQVLGCGPMDADDVTSFLLETDPGLVADHGRLALQASGFHNDIAVHPSQSLDAGEDGGSWQVYLPQQPADPFSYGGGPCFLFIHCQPELCFDDPDVPFCGNFSCGSEEAPMVDGAGNEVWLTGTFNCHT